MPLLIDKQKFLDALPFHLTPEISDGLKFLLGAIQEDPGFAQIPDVAYFLATIRWESASTFQPVKERRADPTANPQLYQLQDRYWNTGFFGRGYVQITWERNYQNAGQRLAGMTFQLPSRNVTMQADTLVNEPDLALEPPIAYQIAARGMREGWFTGHKLRDYIPAGQPPDYFNARKIINGLDHSKAIARYARAFEKFLREAIQTAAESAPA